MITNIGMKYKLHQVLFNHQISPNQPASGLSLQQTLNLVHSPTRSLVKQSGLRQRARLHKLFSSKRRWAYMKTL